MKVAPDVGPASHLGHGTGGVQVVVDDVRIGHEVARVSGKQLVDCCAVVALGEAVEHVPAGHD